ncbi:MAG: hypothetical protein EB037_09490, partial [Actinobacteria bacterium]|nr:hypothetical protein [Actinomycetota bacterium]
MSGARTVRTALSSSTASPSRTMTARVEYPPVFRASLKPIDVAYIRIGSPAIVKLTAYDYTIYGYLTGKVTFVSPDTIREPSALSPEKNVYYKV